jgi:hypothetical protein
VAIRVIAKTGVADTAHIRAVTWGFCQAPIVITAVYLKRLALVVLRRCFIRTHAETIARKRDIKSATPEIYRGDRWAAGMDV